MNVVLLSFTCDKSVSVLLINYVLIINVFANLTYEGDSEISKDYAEAGFFLKKNTNLVRPDFA